MTTYVYIHIHNHLTMRSVFLLLSFLVGVQTFYFTREANSKNHQEITRIAILRATAKVCKTAVPSFQMPGILDVHTLANACQKQQNENRFERGIRVVCYYNVKTDVTYSGNPEYHFDNERFEDGKQLIISGINTAIQYMNNTNFNDARKTLGITLHTLQDFYSHSNWIELSNTEPCTALINQDENIPNPAGKNESTCEEKADGKSDIIRAEILQQKKLTSGYTRKSRPEGKCSHGGFRDFSCGINKDYNTSCHGSLHSRASEVAIKATVQLLEEILRRSDPLSFFRLVGLDERPVEGKLIALLFSAFRNRYPDASEDDNEVVEEPMD